MADTPARVYKSTAADPVSLDPFQTIVNVHWGGGAVHLDGLTYLQRSLHSAPALAGLPDRAFALCSFWARVALLTDVPPGADANLALWNLLLDDDTIVNFGIRPDGAALHVLAGTGNVAYTSEHLGDDPPLDVAPGQLYGKSASDSVPLGEWNHFLWSSDGVGRNFQLYRNNALLPVTVDPNPPDAPFLVPYSQPGVTGSPPGRSIATLGADFQGAFRYTVDLADFWFDGPDHFFDLTVEALRERFVTAEGKRVSLGAHGEQPFGRPPAVYFTGGKDSFATNRGTAGAFTLTGTLQNASSNPP